MKKIVLLLFIITSINGFSQNFKGGLITGIATSQVSGDNLGGFNKAGLNLGVFTQISFSDIINLKIEMNYIQKGSKNPKINQNYIPDISTSYIEIPISVNYLQNEVTFLEIGVQTAFLIRGVDKDLIGNIPENWSNPFYKYDLGTFIGINRIFSKKIILNTRISNSILPIRLHASGSTWILNRGQYNTVLSFTLHYYI